MTDPSVLDLPFSATPLDLLALACFLCLWCAYTWYADSSQRDAKNLVTVLHDYRVKWIERMLEREMRVADTQILSTLQRSDTHFASMTILVLAGLVTLLGSLEAVREVAERLQFMVKAPAALWELKILVLILVMVYAFFKFAWSMRQFNFALVMIGAAPLPREKDSPEWRIFPDQVGDLITRGVDTFNRGMRSYYFAFAALAWFVHPIALIVATLMVIAVLYRREFRSRTLQTLSLGGPKREHVFGRFKDRDSARDSDSGSGDTP